MIPSVVIPPITNLYGEGELVLDTPHKKIFKAIDARNDLMAPEELMVQLVELEVLAKMRELVPTYNGAGTPSA
ncbi:MAG: hypothetical protein HY760_05055 [Nitrospirae bacterium]|nr:hypothetical protein [Nitrospirota bacterium]